MKSKGQASLDYLMTYGWAILLIILVAAALFTLGIFNVNQMMGNKAVGFTQVQVSSFRLLSNGTLYAKFTNEVGVPMALVNANATWVDKGRRSDRDISGPLSVGKTSREIAISDFNTTASPGDTFTIDLMIRYGDVKYEAFYVQYGTLTGIVQ